MSRVPRAEGRLGGNTVARLRHLPLALVPVALAAAVLPFGMRPAHAAETPRLAVSQYARALPADVEAALITFGDTWQIALAPTRNRARLDAALAAIKVTGATSHGIGGALARAGSLIAYRGSPGRSRILILSDAEFLTRALRPAAIPTDVITWKYDSDDFPAAVRRLAAASGGQFAEPSQAATLAAAFPALPPASHPATRSAGAGAAGEARAWGLTGSLMIVLLVVFLVFAFLAYLAVNSLRPGNTRPKLASQIGRYGPMSEPASGAAGQQADGKLASGAVALMTQVLSSGKSEPRLAQRLDRAGITRPPAEWALLGVCFCAGLAAVATLLLGNVPLGIIFGILVGW